MNRLPRKACHTKRALTLIELLIVISMMSIMAFSSMMLMTAPMVEASRATHAQIRMAQTTALLLSLQSDAARAIALRMDDQVPPRLEFLHQTDTGQPAVTVTYALAQLGSVTRQTSGTNLRKFEIDGLTTWQLVHPPEAKSLAADLTLLFRHTPILQASTPAEKQFVALDKSADASARAGSSASPDEWRVRLTLEPAFVRSSVNPQAPTPQVRTKDVRP